MDGQQEENRARLPFAERSMNIIQDIQGIKKSVLNIRDEKENLEAELSALKEEYKRMLAKIQDEKDNLESELNAMKEDSKRMLATIKESFETKKAVLQSEIQELRVQLENKKCECRERYEKQIQKLKSLIKEKEEEQAETLEYHAIEVTRLTSQINEAENLDSDKNVMYERTIERLRNELTQNQKAQKEKTASLEKKISELQKLLEEKENNKDDVQKQYDLQINKLKSDLLKKEETESKLKTSQEEVRLLKSQLQQTEEAKSQMHNSYETAINELMSKLKEKKNVIKELRENCDLLKSEMSSKVTDPDLEEKLHELETGIKTIEDLKAEMQRSFEEEITDLKSQVREKELLVEEVQNFYRKEMKNFREELKQKEDEVKDNKEFYRGEIKLLKAQINERYENKRELLKAHEEEVKKLKDEIREKDQTLITTKADFETERSQLQEKLKQTEDQVAELKAMYEKDVVQPKAELAEKNNKIADLESKNSTLKETCTILDKQLIQFENATSEQLKALSSCRDELNELKNENTSLKEQLKKSRIEANEAKSMKILAEKRLQEVESSLKDTGKESQQRLFEVSRNRDELMTSNIGLKEKISVVENDNKVLQEENSRLMASVQKISEKATTLEKEIMTALDSFVNMKHQNTELSKGLKEAISKAEQYKSRCETMAKEKEASDTENSMREVKLKATISQQSKLIEHLQSQNEALTKKKAKFHLFGGKSKDRDDQDFIPTPSKSTPGFQRPISSANATPVRLADEHLAVQSLEERKACLKQQLEDLKTVKTPILPTPRKEECILLHKSKENSEVGKPHRFQDKTLMKTEKCWGCTEPIYFSRMSSTCTACNGKFHPPCAVVADESCGLPKETVMRLELAKKGKKSTLLTEDEGDKFIESSVLVAGETDWELHRVKMQNGKFLMFGSDPSSTLPVKKFPLNGKTRVELWVNKAEIPIDYPEEKLPFILKVVTPPEVGLRAWDDNKCLFLMTNDNADKRFWTRAIFKNSSYKGSSSTIDSEDLLLDMETGTSVSGIRKTVLFKDNDNRLDINCAYAITNDIYLMGCDSGLFSHKVSTPTQNTKVKIEGVGPIYQIENVPSLNSVLMIEGEKRRLILVHTGILRVCAEAAACSQPKLTVQPVDAINECHLIQVQTVKSEVVVAAATPKHLFLFQWAGNQFVQIKRINTKETITCMLTTANSVIFGSDRVYELDTKSFQLEEFIDASDDSLYFVNYSVDIFGSFPVAILDVGMSNYNPKKGSCSPEYLVCYPDLGVFVDSEGRRTRDEDIVWSKLPLAVAYRHPNLYILHFSSVEIIRLESDSYTRSRVIEKPDTIGKEYVYVPDSRFLYLTSPRYLGYGGKSASVVVSALEKQKTEMVEIDLEWSS